MESNQLQQQFFQQLKNLLAPHLSLAEEVADLLGISTDSAYRRIRGEKPISLDELQKLCGHFQVSLDQLMSIHSNSIIFYGQWADASTFDFQKYLSAWLANLQLINSAKQKLFIYEAKDIPLHHYYQFKTLSSFKFFFWMRTILSYDDYLNMAFEDFVADEALHQTGMEIIKLYNQMPSAEIWTYETVNSMLRQIEYFEAAGILKKRETAQVLYDEVDSLVSHVKHQAACGEKFLYGEKPTGNKNNFQLYFNEISTGHNTGLAETDGLLTVFLNHGVMNYIITRDKKFCELTRKSLENTMKKSSLISSVSEKERSRFFNVLHQKTEEGKKSMVTNFR
jgi:transcriptional regulator with XRE-family HTH domain